MYSVHQQEQYTNKTYNIKPVFEALNQTLNEFYLFTFTKNAEDNHFLTGSLVQKYIPPELMDFCQEIVLCCVHQMLTYNL